MIFYTISNTITIPLKNDNSAQPKIAVNIFIHDDLIADSINNFGTYTAVYGGKTNNNRSWKIVKGEILIYENNKKEKNFEYKEIG